MSVHPNSLANLTRGNSFKKELTKSIQSDLVNLLAEDKHKFREQLELLKPKDYCEVYLQLMKLVMPKQLDVEVTEQPHIEWNIEFVSPKPTDQ